jgi:hypothetical protein
MEIRIAVGERGQHEMPYSEAAMHLRVAGKVMGFQIVSPNMAQLFELPAWKPYSFPVTTGEAGIFSDASGLYYYPSEK